MGGLWPKLGKLGPVSGWFCGWAWGRGGEGTFARPCCEVFYAGHSPILLRMRQGTLAGFSLKAGDLP